MGDQSETQRETFAAELKRFRSIRGHSKAGLARKLGIDPSYVSHLEAGREHGSSALARRMDSELAAAGAVWEAWQRDDASTAPEIKPPGLPASTGLLVLEDAADLRYDGSTYHLRMRRLLRNTGDEPVTRYLVRIAVDRYPGDPERSNAHYRAQPLTWEELQLEAHCGPEAMGWIVKHDRDAFKEVWLTFANNQARYPLYPGQEAEITYSYSVSADKWGPWFQRAVRVPTRELTVSLTFPAASEPTVWGTETSLTADFVPVRTPPAQRADGDRTVFSWTTSNPQLHARYRLEWRLKSPDPEESEPAPMNPLAPSTAMADAGIVQDGDPLLHATARPFTLPAEADEAQRVVAEIFEAIGRVRRLHVFGKGMGLAACQIGIDRAAAVIIPPQDGADPVVLLNPVIAETSSDEDEQYEGCLSYFDVRGLVPRPLSILIAHTEPDGTPRLTRFERGLGRLVLHEVDHLHGTLYRDRMRPGVRPIPVEEYRGTGQSWTYR
ncbi:peptide deformylase [Streptomyces pinistramenti]|uniref:peptide deformylase n=1 Tax=Streptomyces pinistramenti TaxID=2884812 RepID=UPI001D07D72A|nr:peptide deformylase [Streptomyces pinistramenti]MCB5908092.1 peptide deformylase [Streptomyces pinistramenti]